MASLQLPAPLAPWAPFLDLLPLESALALGPLLQRLDAFVGPMRASPQSGSVEPDGFDGLARRGSIERLLLSEWLLLEEAPLEFLRRFSQSESAYFQLARRDPHAARASLALFDCGPQALGAPRLVQLAALFVLARRAENASASFRWGVWQKPGEWQSGVTRESVEWWLSLRSEGEANVDQRAKWEEIWESEGADFGQDELWLLGSVQLKALCPPRARFLELRDELDPFVPNRAVEILIEGRELRLELPAEVVGVRLLRAPFSSVAPKSSDKNSFDVEALDVGLTWAQSGWKLFTRTQNGNLLAFSVPNSPSATVGPPKKHQGTRGLVAAGRVGRATVAAFLAQRTQEPKTSVLLFKAWGRNSEQWGDVQLPFAEEPGLKQKDSLWRAPLGQLLGSGDGSVLALWLENRHLQIAVRGLEKLRDESAGVRGVTTGQNAVELLRTDNSQTQILHLFAHIVDEFVGAPGFEALPPPPILQAFSGWSGRSDAPLWAVRAADRRWHLQAPGRQHELVFESPRAVVGCLFDGDEPSLLLHGAGERELWFRGATEERRIFRFSSAIQHVAVCPFAPLIAVQGHNELGVWSLPHGAWLLRARWD